MDQTSQLRAIVAVGGPKWGQVGDGTDSSASGGTLASTSQQATDWDICFRPPSPWLFWKSVYMHAPKGLKKLRK